MEVDRLRPNVVPQAEADHSRPTNNVPRQRPQRYQNLTSAQERRVRTWAEDQFIHLDAEWNKRQGPGAKLATLSAYIDTIMPIHSVILQIPPTSSSASLRSQFFLRLTIDIFDRCIAYHHSLGAARSPPEELHDELLKLLECFSLFDDGWVAIISSQYWDVDNKKPLGENSGDIVGRERGLFDITGVQKSSNNGVKSSETEKTVLHSALINGKAGVDDWLGDDVHLKDGSLREKFYESFWKTLQILEGDEDGELLGGEVHLTHPGEVTMEVDDMDVDPGMFHGFDDLTD